MELRTGPRHLARLPINLAGVLALAAVSGLYLLFDYLAAVSLTPAIAALACLLSLPGSFLLGYGRAPWARVALPILAIALLLAVAPLDWNSRKPFLRAFTGIAPGMTVEQVDARMAPFRRGRASAAALAPGGVTTIAYRHTDAGRGDADIGLVHFADGRVTRREFLPD